ncbi:MAG TPA: DinB family protein [Tepidiformaceae bacterium]|nr:DinB family protein [Tepidiformaceae bacterium]
MDPLALDRLALTPKTAAHLVAEAPDDILDAAGADGWSARRALAFLRDAESLVHRLRLERILAEETPRLAAFDDARWASSRHTHRDRKEELLADFALQRQATLGLLRALQPEQYRRSGRLPTGEPLTVADLVDHLVAHDAVQVQRMERALGTTIAEVRQRRFHPPQ